MREETEDSEDPSVARPARNQSIHNQPNQNHDQEDIQQLQDSDEDQIYNLSMEGVDHECSMHTSNEINQIITSSNESLDNPTAILPKAKSYRHVRRTLSGALEVGGYLGVSVAARASPHMESRHHPQDEHQQQQQQSSECYEKHVV